MLAQLAPCLRVIFDTYMERMVHKRSKIKSFKTIWIIHGSALN